VQPAPLQHAPTMTEAEAKALIDANVISSDKKNVGEVAAIQRDGSGKVTELHADVGGFLGIGETRVRLMPSQFTVSNKQIVLTLTADQVRALPKIEKK
jgi:ribosomal 30S subunit maturation factor RimM